MVRGEKGSAPTIELDLSWQEGEKKVMPSISPQKDE